MSTAAGDPRMQPRYQQQCANCDGLKAQVHKAAIDLHNICVIGDFNWDTQVRAVIDRLREACK